MRTRQHEAATRRGTRGGGTRRQHEAAALGGSTRRHAQRRHAHLLERLALLRAQLSRQVTARRAAPRSFIGEGEEGEERSPGGGSSEPGDGIGIRSSSASEGAEPSSLRSPCISSSYTAICHGGVGRGATRQIGRELRRRHRPSVRREGG